MPRWLRPTAATAADAILVGDPGRALLLAQELLEQPKMSNHARGLWGYYGLTPAGRPLTVQSTGIGGPSAALVLADLAELGVRRTVRVGTCVATDTTLGLGELLLVGAALASGGSASAFGGAAGELVFPDDDLTARLGHELGPGMRQTRIASVDAHPGEAALHPSAKAADMQTAPLFAQARARNVAVAGVLIVTELAGDPARLEGEPLKASERRAGRSAAATLSG